MRTTAYFTLYTALYTILRPLLLLAILFISACESKWEAMNEDELVEKASRCLNMNDPAPAMIQVCKNYKRECERRFKETGRYIC
jgi:hypothetical protein